MSCICKISNISKRVFYKNLIDSDLHLRTVSKSFKRTLHRLFGNKPKPRFVPENIVRPPYVLYGNDVSPSESEIQTDEKINHIRQSCKLAAYILKQVGRTIEEGMTTNDIDALVHKLCIEAGAYPSPLLYKGYPKSVCTSVNHVACHGVPCDERLEDGDMINVDVTVFINGHHGDTSETFVIGDTDLIGHSLIESARECRDAAISLCRDGALFSDIGNIIYVKAQESGFNVIPNFCGHGIGSYFHGPPDIVHVPSLSGTKGQMKAGMVFTIEPIICEGSPDIKILSDNWTAITRDQGRSAQFEHTILITKDGNEILT